MSHEPGWNLGGRKLCSSLARVTQQIPQNRRHQRTARDVILVECGKQILRSEYCRKEYNRTARQKRVDHPSLRAAERHWCGAQVSLVNLADIEVFPARRTRQHRLVSDFNIARYTRCARCDGYVGRGITFNDFRLYCRRTLQGCSPVDNGHPGIVISRLAVILKQQNVIEFLVRRLLVVWRRPEIKKIAGASEKPGSKHRCDRLLAVAQRDSHNAALACSLLVQYRRGLARLLLEVSVGHGGLAGLRGDMAWRLCRMPQDPARKIFHGTSLALVIKEN